MLNPKPVQKPHPPIIVGGSSENVVRLAVEEADGWDVDTGPCSFEMFQQRYAQMEKYCSEVGRKTKSVRISLNATPIFAKSIPEAKKFATIWAKRTGLTPEEYISNKSVFLGTAEDIISSAEKWFESGANQINFLMPQDAKYAEDFCKAIARMSR
jgi:alkanesulfonate monooxygenase SsuD/methylene tetrahydromethanopterin reductase-like flavin-dependent oxidoreductase (luciferase family)